uniref:Dynein assembly factor 1, axonemal homolog n=1 Tax=Pyramimonas obovata TaxID=1411642 RepID=A0A7S0R4Q2_9CHLO
MEMTKEWLKKHCKEQNQYGTPALNDKLYLHFKGFHAIENLEEYTGLKALFLEGNAIDSLDGLQGLTNLKCLFIQQNCIPEIEEGVLDTLTELSNFNLSNNNIRKLQNLQNLTCLHTLQLANNFLPNIESISHLRECPSISVLDLSNNKIEGTYEELIELLKAMPNLSVVYLKGNPIVNNIKSYRKNLIASMPKLTYLDDRPVFPNERRCAEAWYAAGGGKEGLEAERMEREKIAEEKKAEDDRQYQFMKKIVDRKPLVYKDGRYVRRDDIDVDGEDISDDEGSDYEEEEEPEELVAARKRLAELQAANRGVEKPVELIQAQ